MSLQVWLPLNGSTVNQGLSGLGMAGSPNSWSDGKIGKCATFAGTSSSVVTNVVHSNTNLLNYTDNFSWCMWIKTNYTSGKANFVFTVGRADAGTYGYGLEVRRATECKIWFGNRNYSVSVTGGEWTHLTFTKSGNIISMYKNGVLTGTWTFDGTPPTYTESAGLGIGCFHYISNTSTGSVGNIYPFYGDINDFRIYDHCLSPREVKEIAKGLVCHYPMNDPTSTSSINKYSGNTFEGSSGTSSDTRLVITKLTDERGCNYKLSYVGTGTSNWYSVGFPHFSFTAGKKYDYSCKIRCNSCTSNLSMNMRAARIGNDWEAARKVVISSSLADGKWHEYHIIITLQATSDRAGTTYNTNPCLEFYTNDLKTKDAVFSFDFDIKDAQVSECDWETTVSDRAWGDNVVYDTSGFGNHGAVATASAPSWSNDSPRYDGCYLFNGTNNFFTAPKSAKVTDEITVSIWAYMIDWSKFRTGDMRLVSCAEGGGWSIDYYKDDNVVFSLYAAGAYRNCLSTKKWSSLSSGWHHFAATYNGLKSCLYIDGVLDSSITPFTTKTPITYNACNTIFIGAEAAGTTTTPAGNYFAGKLSDFRLYATALSDADIKELYNAPISVTNTGVLMAQGEFKEE